MPPAIHVMESVPGADRGPSAGSPRGVVDATGLTLAGSNDAGTNDRSVTDCGGTRSLPLPVLTSSPKLIDYHLTDSVLFIGHHHLTQAF